jgi:hypothetical protein
MKIYVRVCLYVLLCLPLDCRLFGGSGIHAWGIPRHQLLFESFLDLSVYRGFPLASEVVVRRYNYVGVESGLYMVIMGDKALVVDATARVSLKDIFFPIYRASHGRMEMSAVETIAARLEANGDIVRKQREIGVPFAKEIGSIWSELFDRCGNIDDSNVFSPRWSFTKERYQNTIFYKDTNEDACDIAARSMIRIANLLMEFVDGRMADKHLMEGVRLVEGESKCAGPN